MTYPQQTQQWPPAQPYAPGYPPQQPGFPPQQPGYPPQQQATYAQPPPQPLATGSFDQFFAQPSAGGGAALKFEQVGTVHVGIVARRMTMGDVQQQTQPGTGVPQFYKDGRPKFVMKVPLRVTPSEAHPDGLAQWYVAGQSRDELVRAMSVVGAPEGPPEEGAAIRVEFTGTRGGGQGIPAKVYAVQYQRPQGAAPVQASPSPPQPEQPAQQQQVLAPAVPEQQVAQPPAAPPAQPPAATPAGPEGFSAEQNALLAQLTGGQPAATG